MKYICFPIPEAQINDPEAFHLSGLQEYYLKS